MEHASQAWQLMYVSQQAASCPLSESHTCRVSSSCDEEEEQDKTKVCTLFCTLRSCSHLRVHMFGASDLGLKSPKYQLQESIDLSHCFSCSAFGICRLWLTSLAGVPSEQVLPTISRLFLLHLIPVLLLAAAAAPLRPQLPLQLLLDKFAVPPGICMQLLQHCCVGCCC